MKILIEPSPRHEAFAEHPQLFRDPDAAAERIGAEPDTTGSGPGTVMSRLHRTRWRIRRLLLAEGVTARRGGAR